MFCGPSGVGKTLLAKQFGKVIVGNVNVIKLDMSEYKEAHSISKIIGAPPGYAGYDDVSNILEEIKNKPFSVLILDEIEKAHPNIINLFSSKLKSSILRFISSDLRSPQLINKCRIALSLISVILSLSEYSFNNLFDSSNDK